MVDSGVKKNNISRTLQESSEEDNDDDDDDLETSALPVVAPTNRPERRPLSGQQGVPIDVKNSPNSDNVSLNLKGYLSKIVIHCLTL